MTVKVDNNFGDVHETADVDGIIRKIEKQLYDEFEVEPEGVLASRSGGELTYTMCRTGAYGWILLFY